MDRGESDHHFLAAQRSFAAAVAANPLEQVTQYSTLAGRNLAISFVGSALVQAIAPSFRHLTRGKNRGSKGDEIQVLLWDCKATGISPPEVPTSTDWVVEGEGWRASSHGQGRYLCEVHGEYWFWLDRFEARLIGCFRDAEHLRCTDRARPLQRVMGEFCRLFNIQEIHAGLVAKAGRGVLIVGGSGRGKSTTSIDGLYEGLDFLGDDSVAIGQDQAGAFQGHSLYASARVMPSQLIRWPQFAEYWRSPCSREQKHLLLPDLVLPNQMALTSQIVAIAIPSVQGSGQRVMRASPLEAFHALVHESRSNRRFGLTTTEFARLTKMIKKVPSYRFEVNDVPARVAEGLHQLLDGANG